MTTNQKQNIQQQELNSKLWAIANELRSNMDASEFKNYILGLIFYRYLSEQLLHFTNEQLKGDNISYKDAYYNDEYKDELIKELTDEHGVGYVIKPEYLWSTLIEKIQINDFDVEMLNKAIVSLVESTLGKKSEEDFANLFNDMDLNSPKLGRTTDDKSKLLAKVMSKLDDINFYFNEAEIDILGDAYEYLISQFAASAGKKAGEFYTPQQVSKLLAKIVCMDKKQLNNVYDPTCGSGSLLLRLARETKVYWFYGQEKNSTTYNLARMNMLLHKIKFSQFNIYNQDTLEHPSEKHLQMKFEAIVANPPYSAKWSANAKFNNDERFSIYGHLAPESKADYAFVQHMIYLLDDNGTMAVVLPHGVLFRNEENKIRKHLIDKNYLDTIIGLPPNLFFGTSIATCILVFKKCKKNNDILFIDASKEFDSNKNQNRLTDENVDKIIQTYAQREFIEKYAYVASYEEIQENDYNLNIARYVDTYEEEAEIDINDVLKEINNLKIELANVDKEIDVYLKELGILE